MPTQRHLLPATPALLAAAALCFTAPPAAAVGDCTPSATWPANQATAAAQVVDLVNQHRTGMGLLPLGVSPTLTASSVWKARHMAQYRYMAHDDPAPPVARSAPDRATACGYQPYAWGWGENI